MSKTKTTQKSVLARLEKYFAEKLTAATPLEEGTHLTVLLSDLVEGAEIYGDLWFPPVAKDYGDFKLFALEFEVMDASSLSDEAAMDLMVGAAMQNAAIPMGGFGLATNEEGDKLTQLTFRHMLPLTASFSEDQLYETIEKTFFALCTVMKDALPDLLSLAKGELSKEDFLKRL